MSDEGEILGVHVSDEIGYASEGLRVRVGQISPKADGVAAAVVVAVIVVTALGGSDGSGDGNYKNAGEGQPQRTSRLPEGVLLRWLRLHIDYLVSSVSEVSGDSGEHTRRMPV